MGVELQMRRPELLYSCYKLIQLFRVNCFIAGQYCSKTRFKVQFNIYWVQCQRFNIQMLDDYWVSGIQMVKSHDLADHSNTGHFGPLTGFSPVRFSDHHSIPDRLTTRHKSTI